jgi:cell pole-organizing protein PopZ
MTQANAQREPSMEEILSSIRRIIEDSDTTKQFGGAMAKPAPEPAPATSAVEDDVNAFRRELHPVQSVPDVEPAAEAQTEDAFVDFTKLPPEDELETVTVDPVEPNAAKPSLADIAAMVAPKQPIAEVPAPTVEPVKQVAPEAVIEAESAEPEARSETRDALQPLISPATGRQVQAAFDELNDAFRKSRAKSFEDVAEEMLRPMLQDWLDNNLPVMVERLVREEIERVARGG